MIVTMMCYQVSWDSLCWCVFSATDPSETELVILTFLLCVTFVITNEVEKQGTLESHRSHTSLDYIQKTFGIRRKLFFFLFFCFVFFQS